jgi:N-acetylmuramic acid 6-phosphate (MurNAc-6-P) etherase
MLCVQATNAKLKDRQARILAGQIDRLSTAEAYQLLSDLDWNLQAGLLVASGWTVSEALDALALERPLRELLRSR